jgi:hypothetical protein
MSTFRLELNNFNILFTDLKIIPLALYSPDYYDFNYDFTHEIIKSIENEKVQSNKSKYRCI